MRVFNLFAILSVGFAPAACTHEPVPEPVPDLLDISGTYAVSWVPAAACAGPVFDWPYYLDRLDLVRYQVETAYWASWWNASAGCRMASGSGAPASWDGEELHIDPTEPRCSGDDFSFLQTVKLRPGDDGALGGEGEGWENGCDPVVFSIVAEPL